MLKLKTVLSEVSKRTDWKWARPDNMEIQIGQFLLKLVSWSEYKLLSVDAAV
jgi:hypothetical protein